MKDNAMSNKLINDIFNHLPLTSGAHSQLERTVALVAELEEPMTYAGVKARAAERRKWGAWSQRDALAIDAVIQACDAALAANVAAAEAGGEISFGGR